jgi:hypothetical protein
MERRNREWDEVRWGAAVLVAPFIGPEDGRGGGAVRGNGRRRRCAIKAFKPSVLEGETRGQWGVKRGQKCGAVSGRGGVVGAAGACGGGGGGGAQSGFRRKKMAGLTDWVGPPVSEGEAMGQARPERKGGGRAEIVPQAEIQKSKRKSILIDFWIKIGLEIE